MPQKPSRDLILETYTKDEIVELLKEKVIQDATLYINSFKQNLSMLTGLFQGSQPAETMEEPSAPARRGRKPQSEKESGAKGTKKRGRPARGASRQENGSGAVKQGLGDLILNVLGKVPMKIEEILEQVHNNGWETKSKKPRTLISQELAKQLKKGMIEKAERGTYKKA